MLKNTHPKRFYSRAFKVATMCALLQLNCLNAIAQEQSVKRVGDWMVVTVDSEGEKQCLAATVGKYGDFRIFRRSGGNIALRFNVNGLQLPLKKYSVIVAIDDSEPWHFPEAIGDAEHIEVLLGPSMGEQAVELLREILDGRALALRSNLNTRVAEFSLMGSGKAFQMMAACDQGERE